MNNLGINFENFFIKNVFILHIFHIIIFGLKR